MIKAYIGPDPEARSVRPGIINKDVMDALAYALQCSAFTSAEVHREAVQDVLQPGNGQVTGHFGSSSLRYYTHHDDPDWAVVFDSDCPGDPERGERLLTPLLEDAKERGEMSDKWQGCLVSNRLNLWYDDDMNHWALSGKDEYLAATGSAGEMMRLALAILERLPDTDENGPPVRLDEECEALPPIGAMLLATAANLARDQTGTMTGEQCTRLAGGLMAVATHMLGAQSDEAWTSCRTSRFPFSMRLDPDPASPGR